jgi:hypothetical protein
MREWDKMKNLLLLALLISTSNLFAGTCTDKVLSHYKTIYHRTYKAASNTFLNNFVGRKNMTAHAFGEPLIAFENLLISGENYYAQNIVNKSCKSGRDVYEIYMELLDSGKLCDDLGEDYKKPGKMKRYLLDHL